MSDLSDFVSPDAVVASLPAASKRALFGALARAAGDAYGFDRDIVVDAVAAREKLGSTGFGGGVAIPHARLDGLDRVRGVFARLPQAINYAAVDALPVDLVFLLLSPVDAGSEHLKALARVSRALRDRSFADKLRGAGSPDALYALLSGVEARDAA